MEQLSVHAGTFMPGQVPDDGAHGTECHCGKNARYHVRYAFGCGTVCGYCKGAFEALGATVIRITPENASDYQRTEAVRKEGSNADTVETTYGNP